MQVFVLLYIVFQYKFNRNIEEYEKLDWTVPLRLLNP